MADPAVPAPCRLLARVRRNEPVSSGLLLLELEPEPPARATSAEPDFYFPGQFVMLNRPGARAWTFGRPLSILDWDAGRLRFLYRVVGRGTAELAGLDPGAELTLLGPLGRPFPADTAGLTPVLIAGGVGLPPVWSWRMRRPGEDRERVRAYFGARDRDDAPLSLLTEGWTVAVEKRPAEPDPALRRGLVTDVVRADLEGPEFDGACSVLACGPAAMLAAVRDLCAERNWDCWLSLEEHMGCGYGVCKGCVVPVVDAGAKDGWRPATCCQEGPVFASGELAWDRMSGGDTP